MAARRLRYGAITWCRSQRPKDREHYAIKQVNPVAEPELAAPGLRFGRVIGDDRDMELSLLDRR